jgi:hypothetical protein
MRINFRFFLFFSFLFVLISSCKKDEQITVPGNEAPPDYTIPNSTKENYINKVYISVLGREPDSTEFAKSFSILNQNNLSVANRKQFLDSVLATPVYNDRLYQIAREELLNDLDTNDITLYMAVFQGLLADTVNRAFWPQITFELNRLDTLKRVSADLASDAINIIEMHRRCVNNFFYDQINMGTENFVVSMFQNFLFRYPTTSELSESKTMVDGQNAVLFYNIGRSKPDFLNIFFSSTSYFEGQVRALFVRYLFREPTSSEVSSYTVLYKNSLDYKDLQKDILSSNEYAGIQ